MQAPHGHPLLALCLSLQVVPRTAYRPAHHPTIVAQASSDQPYNVCMPSFFTFVSLVQLSTCYEITRL